MKRRSFLQTVAVSAGMIGRQACGAQPPVVELEKPIQEDKVEGMPRRLLGRTGVRVSIIGYPGFALREADRTQAECTASLAHALENGVNYFDVAPAYADGLCEERMGRGFADMAGFRRESIFLACKTKERTAEGARQELERSLERLKTDYFDLYQLHCLMKPDEDVEAAFGAGGAMETVLKAKEEGKIRFIGFSAHTTRAALTAMSKYRFDTVMFPINFVEMFTFGFGNKVLERATEQGAGVLAIKPMSAGDWPAEMTWDKRPRKWWYRTLEDPAEIGLALRYTLSQRAVVAGLPPAWLDLAEKAIQAGKQYAPLTEPELTRLRTMAGNVGSVFQAGELASCAGRREMYACRGPHEGTSGAMG